MDINDDLFTTLPLQPPGMLLADGHMDFMDIDDVASILSSELLDDGYMSPVYDEQTSLVGGSGSSIKTEPMSSYSSDESVDLNEYQTINPDDFLHDLFKSEVKQEMPTDQNSDSRQTPSPSASSNSSTGSTRSDYNDYRIDMPAATKTGGADASYALETPPVSPPSPDGSSSSSSSCSTQSTTTPMAYQSPITVPAHIQYAQAIPVVQGTLIPISTMNLTTTSTLSNTTTTSLPPNFKRIRIQPKPPASNTSETGNNLTNGLISGIRKTAGPPKRIVLSAQDYTALMQKCKTQPASITVKPITIKAAPPATVALQQRPPPSANVVRTNAPITVQMTPSIPAVHTTLSLAPAPPQLIQPQAVSTGHTATPLLLPAAGQVLRPKVITIPPIAQVMRIVPQSTATTLQTLNTTTAPVLTSPAPQSVARSAIIQPAPLGGYTSSTHLPRVAPKTETTPRVEVEDKLQKKHQRMIKNRESACLSRKKKKDYMTSLEQQIAELGDDNKTLRTQNTFLRDRVQQLESLVCVCGKAVTERQATGTVRLLPMVQRNKKNAMFVLAVVFMVSLNFGPFGNMMGGNIDSSLQSSSASTHHTRHLLWDDDEINSLTNGSTTDPPTNRSNNGSRTIIPAFKSPPQTSASTSTTGPAYPMCPLYVNQTENVRLASELRRWIGDLPQYLNINATDVEAAKERGIDLNSISNYLLNDDTIRSLFRQLRTTGDETGVAARKKPIAAVPNDRRDSRNLDENGVVGHVKRSNGVPATDYSRTAENATDHQRLQLYDPVNRDALQYAELIEQLRRQDDTFYVVSFSGDHLLLPALAHNKTYRPKMSLMLPSVGINATYGAAEYVTLMQIDCEVVNTSLIHIKEKLIPRHLRSKTATAAKKSAAANRTTNAGRRRSASTAAAANKSAHPVALNGTGQAFNQTNSGYDAFNGTDVYNVTAGRSSDEFAYAGQYKPYFVDKTREKGDKFVAGP